MSASEISRKDVDEILRLIESAEHVAEFRIKYGDVEINVSRLGEFGGAPLGNATSSASTPIIQGALSMPSAASESRPGATATAMPQTPAGGAAAVDAGLAVVRAPMVGTFYRAPSPGANPFVEIGSRVQVDTVVGIIEVMKLMNSLPAGVSGTVQQILVSDSQPVGFGDPLIVIKPDA